MFVDIVWNVTSLCTIAKAQVNMHSHNRQDNNLGGQRNVYQKFFLLTKEFESYILKHVNFVIYVKLAI